MLILLTNQIRNFLKKITKKFSMKFFREEIETSRLFLLRKSAQIGFRMRTEYSLRRREIDPRMRVITWPTDRLPRRLF